MAVRDTSWWQCSYYAHTRSGGAKSGGREAPTPADAHVALLRPPAARHNRGVQWRSGWRRPKAYWLLVDEEKEAAGSWLLRRGGRNEIRFRV
jgi:hypothetical protein